MSIQWKEPVSEGPAGTFAWGGFAVSSNVELPRLATTPADADVRFTWRGRPPPTDLPVVSRRWEVTTADGGTLQLAAGRDDEVVRYEIGGVGVYRIGAPNAAIDFYPSAEAEVRQVEHFLVNTVLAVYAGLRSVVCLHAAAVSREGAAVVFAGPPRAGKSTAAWRLVGRGWRLLTDDAAVLRSADGAWRAFPGPCTLRLKGLGESGWDNRGKTEVILPLAARPAQVREVVLLDRWSPSSARPSTRAEVYRSLLGLQAGWPWAPAGTRRALEEMTWHLADRLQITVGEESAVRT